MQTSTVSSDTPVFSAYNIPAGQNPAEAIMQMVQAGPSNALIIVPSQRVASDLNTKLQGKGVHTVKDYAAAIELVASHGQIFSSAKMINNLDLDILLQHLTWQVASELAGYDYFKQNLDLPALRRFITTYFSYHQDLHIAIKQDSNGAFLELLMQRLLSYLKEHNLQMKQQRLNYLVDGIGQKHTSLRFSHTYVLLSTSDVPYIRQFILWLSKQPSITLFTYGLDLGLSNPIWDSLPQTHPQHQYLTLLRNLQLSRSCFQECSYGANASLPAAVHERLRVVMHPSQYFVNEVNRVAQVKVEHYLSHIEMHECATIYEEATLIASDIKRILEHKPDSKIQIIAEHRGLVRVLKVLLAHNKISHHDSTPLTLADTPCAGLVHAVWRLCLEGAAHPALILQALENPLVTLCNRDELASWEVQLRYKLKEGRTILTSWQELVESERSWLQILAKGVLALKELCQSGNDQRAIMGMHLALILQLVAPSTEVALLLEQLRIEIEAFAHPLQGDYLQCITHYLAQKPLPTPNTTPQVTILSTLESRYQVADIVILSALNAESTVSMNSNTGIITTLTAKRLSFSNAALEFGLAAHDWHSQLYSPRVILTRAKDDGGVVTQPSCWLERLEMVGLLVQGASQYDQGKRISHKQDNAKLRSPPAPRPPVAVRVKDISVSGIELLMRDPYSFYARYILGLRALPDVHADTKKIDIGIALHYALEKIEKAALRSREEYTTEMLSLFRQYLQELARHDKAQLGLWCKQLVPILHRLHAFEQEHAGTVQQSLREKKCVLDIDGIKVTARVDRADVGHDRIMIYDYKTGAMPTQQEIRKGLSPQLLVPGIKYNQEAQQSGQSKQVGVAYIALSLQRNAKLLHMVNVNLEAAYLGLKELCSTYLEESTAFIAMPNPGYKAQDYAHLRREQEWGVG